MPIINARHWLFLINCLIFVSVGLLQPRRVLAQVVINEVHPSPSQGSDWVELKNTSQASVLLTGWTMEDSSSAMTPLPSFASVNILPSEYLVVEVSNRLNTGSDQVILKNSSGQVVDQMSYVSSQTDVSWARVPDGTGEFILHTPNRGAINEVIVPSPAPTPTPTPSITPAPSTSPNPTPSLTPTPSPSPAPTPSLSPTPTPSPHPSPTPSPTPIVIISPSPHPSPEPSPTPSSSPQPTNIEVTEILACPEANQDEWVELHNPTATPAILDNWHVRDGANHLRSFTLYLEPFGYVAFALQPSILNNGGDALTLEHPDNTVIFSTEFGTCKSAQSWIPDGEGWQLTKTPTPGQANTAPTDSNQTDTDSAASTDTENSSGSTSNEEISSTTTVAATKTITSKAASDSAVLGTNTATPSSTFLDLRSDQASPFELLSKFRLPPVWQIAAVAIGCAGLTSLGLFAWRWYTVHRATPTQPFA